MRQNIQALLSQMISDLDIAISRAVENPILFADIPLDGILSTCRNLEMAANEPNDLTGDAWERERVQRLDLLWKVRSRAGRLQLLMDSASQFYNSCFSPAEPECLAYGVHGEWSAMSATSHVTVDC